MKQLSTYILTLSLFFGALLLFGLAACQSDTDAETENEVSGIPAGEPPMVEVTAVDYAFVAPDTIPSGWTTFKMKNEGEEIHHFHLYRLPEGKRLEDFLNDYSMPLDSLLQRLKAGRIDSAEARTAYDHHVRDWARPANLDKRGGMGGISPGRTGQATFKIDPGTYVMDCGIRNLDGRLHWALGMIRKITVTETSSGASPPQADATIRVSGNEFTFDQPLTAGAQTIRFEVDSIMEDVDSAYYATLARLDQNTGVEDLKKWARQGYQSPAPTEYVGGFEYIEADRTVFTTVDLVPGQYAWHWDYWGEEQPDFFEEFTVE